MRVLLSTIGSRGDVQPLVALASELKVLAQQVHLCVPPDFREWIENLGMSVTPIGSELRTMTASRPPTAAPPMSPEQRRQLAEASVATQFETVATAAQGCDVIVAATALQIAARSVAERMGIPYVFVAYSPNVLPSPHHAPPPLPPLPGQAPTSDSADNRELWAQDAARFNALPAIPGSQPIPRWRPGPIPRTNQCFSRAPGFCRTIVHSLANWRTSSRTASRQSISVSAASARRRA